MVYGNRFFNRPIGRKKPKDENSSQKKNDKEKKEKHTIVQLKGSEIRLLLPDGYKKLSYKNPIRSVYRSINGRDTAYRKTIGYSDNMVYLFRTNEEYAMNPDDLDGLIDGIHGHLADNQGIIEVKNGVTNRGYKYIYSIVKNLMEEVRGVRYFLRLNVFRTDDDIVEIQADFTEVGMTGVRESVCVDLARRAGLTDITKDGFSKWSQDPYDPDYRNGKPKNLAEKQGLDALFPYSPLTQAHEFLLAVLEDKFVITKRDDTDAEKNHSASDNKMSEQEILSKLFVDECLRITYAVDVSNNHKQ